MASLVLDDIELQLPPTVDELVTEDGEAFVYYTLAEAERQRAERLETELARLRARLRELGVNPDESA